MTRDELIAVLEKATEPDRELDAKLARSDGWTRFSDYWLSPSGQQRQFHAPGYTSSIDAALTLVPDGWRLQVFSEWDNDALRARGPWQAIFGRAGEGDCFAGKAHCDHAPTPALAICIAALKARGE